MFANHRYTITVWGPGDEGEEKIAIHTAFGVKERERFKAFAKEWYPAGTRLEIVDETKAEAEKQKQKKGSTHGA
jgi:hypothetical protein